MKNVTRTLVFLTFIAGSTAAFAGSPAYKVSIDDITLANAGPGIPRFASDCTAPPCVDWWNGLGWGAVDPEPDVAPIELIGASSHRLLSLDGVLVLVDRNKLSISNGFLMVNAISNGFFVYEGETDTRFVLQATRLDTGITNLVDLENIFGEVVEVEPSDGHGSGGGSDIEIEWYLDDILGRGSHWSTEYADVIVDGVLMSMPKHTIHSMVHSGGGQLVR